ncbi:hypothetical protein Tco_1050490, partial [Tanacetum coccineum]
VEMDDSNLTMEEYIELEAKKARRRGQTFNWKTATYVKVSNLKTDSDNDNDEVNIPSNDVVVERLDSGIDVNIDTQSHEFDKDFETNHDIHRESSNMEYYLIIIKVAIQKHFHEGMPFIFMIKNLYVSFGIPFDPKRFYKDGGYTMKLRRPRYGTTTPQGLEGLTDRLRMVYSGAEGHVLFTSHALRRLLEIQGSLLGGARRSMSSRQFILALGLHTAEEMAGDGFDCYWADSLMEIATKADLSGYSSMITSNGNFLEIVPSYTFIRDPLRRLCHRLIMGTAVNVPYLLAQYMFRHAEGRKRGSRMSGSYFVRRLAKHFVLVTEEGLQGLIVVVGELRVIDMDELADQETPKEGVQADPKPVQAPQAFAAAPASRTMPHRMTRLEEEVHGVRERLGEQCTVLDAMRRDFSRFTRWTVGRLSQLLDVSGMTYTSYDDYQIPYQRCTR